MEDTILACAFLDTSVKKKQKNKQILQQLKQNNANSSISFYLIANNFTGKKNHNSKFK